MSIRIVDQGEEAFLDLITNIDMTLRLFKTDTTAGLTETQIDALDESDFDEAVFAGYAASSMTTAWTTTQGDFPSTATRAQVTFTRSSTGAAETIYGYYVTRNSDGALMWFEDFTGPITVTNAGDAIVVTPTLTLDDDREATVTARGVVGTPFSSTSNSSTWSADATTDMTVTNLPVDSTRRYRVHLHTDFFLSAAARWLVTFNVDGTLVDRFDDLDYAAAVNGFISSAIEWEPATDTVDIDVRVDEISGTATLAFNAAATAARKLWVEDIGPR